MLSLEIRGIVFREIGVWRSKIFEKGGGVGSWEVEEVNFRFVG